MQPSSIRTMRSANWIVPKLCEMRKVVRPRKNSSMALRIRASS